MASCRATNGWAVLLCRLGEDPHEQHSAHVVQVRVGRVCASNHLNISDTCFISMMHEAMCSDDEDKEWEEQEYDEAKLKVEVRKTNDEWRR